MIDFSNRVVLVTGAAGGIGAATARTIARCGGEVVVHDVRAGGRLGELADELGDRAHAVVADLADPAEPAALGERALHGRGRIDVLINNAGIYSDRGACGDEACRGEDATQSFGELDYELFDTIMAVNVRGPLLVAESFAEHVRASRQKKIASISSTNGSITFTLGGSGAIAYRASKAALNRAMQLVAVNQRSMGVTVLLLHPGAVLTERQAHLTFPGMIQMQPSVAGMIEQIEKATLADTGRFIQYDGATAPW
jgi:NAD(P)-dependent dehydrogenase (short-subunit alcohol dehydrogenase family)